MRIRFTTDEHTSALPASQHSGARVSSAGTSPCSHKSDRGAPLPKALCGCALLTPHAAPDPTRGARPTPLSPPSNRPPVPPLGSAPFPSTPSSFMYLLTLNMYLLEAVTYWRVRRSTRGSEGEREAQGAAPLSRSRPPEAGASPTAPHHLLLCSPAPGVSL